MTAARPPDSREPPPDLPGGAALPPIWVRVAVAAAVRPVPGGAEVVVSRRHASAVRGGLWEFPGGKVEPGERPEEAAARELLEETGIRAAAGSGRLVATVRHHDPGLRHEPAVELVMVRFDVESGIDPAPIGSAECRWESLDGLDRLEWPGGNRELVRALRLHLGTTGR